MDGFVTSHNRNQICINRIISFLLFILALFSFTFPDSSVENS